MTPPASLDGGRLVLDAQLGRGGFGAVYRARDLSQGGALRAVKLLHPHLAREARHLARFRREAEVTAMLAHPHVARTYETGGEPDGTQWIVMELLEGPSLAELIGRDGALDPSRAIRIARQILSALAATHSIGVIHRDLKPSNVVVTKGADGREHAKIVDFGIARFTTSATYGELTRTGQVVGTPAFMPLEQALGQAIDARADLYAVGAILHTMLTTEPPFGRGSYADLLPRLVGNDRITLLERRPDLGPLATLVERALATDRSSRPENAASFEAALAALDPTAAPTLVEWSPPPTIESLRLEDDVSLDFADVAPGAQLEGSRLGDRYRIGPRLGEGGMGVVYAATDERFGRDVAIKVLQPTLLSHPGALARFRAEAERAGKLSHPHVVKILDIGRDDAGAVFIAMERLEGEPLSRRIARGPMPERDVVRIAAEVLSALEAAHGARLVHRDLKPDNIFLANVPGIGVHVKVLDFGIAKALDETGGSTKLTATGTLIGTLLYMAPEQARGADVDERADLYSLGAVLYESLMGRPAFEEKRYERLLLAILGNAPRSLREQKDSAGRALVSQRLSEIVERAMAKRADDRFQSARDMAAALATCVEQGAPWAASARARTHAVASTDTSSTPALRPRDLPRRTLTAALGIATAVVALLAIWSFQRTSAPPPAPTTATPTARVDAVTPLRSVDAARTSGDVQAESTVDPDEHAESPTELGLADRAGARAKQSHHARSRQSSGPRLRVLRSSVQTHRYPIRAFTAGLDRSRDWASCWPSNVEPPQIDRARCFYVNVAIDGRVTSASAAPRSTWGGVGYAFDDCVEARLQRLVFEAQTEACEECRVCFLIEL